MASEELWVTKEPTTRFRTEYEVHSPLQALAHVYAYAEDSGRIATATFPGSATPISITRWPHDGEKVVTYPGGVTREVDYDVRGPVSEIRIKPPSGTPLVEKWAYAYTDVLNVGTMTDAASRVTTYGYDSLDRLTSADHPVLPAPQNTLPDLETFTYDGVGNRTMTGYAHDANQRMRTSPGHSYDYDDDGNTKLRDPGQAGQASYTWDLENRLTGFVNGGTSASYAQDAFARRFKKTVGATATWTLWSGGNLLAEYNGSGTRTARYTTLDNFAPAQMAVPNGGTELIYTVHADRLGTPRVMTSSSGTVVWQAAYEAYGKAHLSTGLATPLNVRLPGQYFDAESGGHYSHFRYFDPAAGRYASPDPILRVPWSAPHVYVGNRPTSAVDPLGLEDMLTITVNRSPSSSQATTSTYETNTGLSGVGVEPPSGNNSPGSSIPDGTYRGELRTADESSRFSVDQIRVRDVPGNRSSDSDPVLWHPGNSPNETRACYLPGKRRAPDGTGVENSRSALRDLTEQVDANASFNRWYSEGTTGGMWVTVAEWSSDIRPPPGDSRTARSSSHNFLPQSEEGRNLMSIGAARLAIMFFVLHAQVCEAGGDQSKTLVDTAWEEFVKHPSPSTARAVLDLLPSAYGEINHPMIKESELAVLEMRVQAHDPEALNLAVGLYPLFGAHMSEQLGVIAGQGIPNMALEFLLAVQSRRASIGRVGPLCGNL